MFEDLKREHAAGLSSKERMRLTMFVAGCLILGVALVGLQSCPDSKGSGTPAASESDEKPTTRAAPIQLDPEALDTHTTREVGSGERVEMLDAYAPEAVKYMRLNVEGEPPAPLRIHSPSELQALERAGALGQVFDVEGEVVARTQEVFESDRQRLWSLVLQGEDGGQVVIVKHGYGSDAGEGVPYDDYQAIAQEEILVGQYVLARGYYMQRRTGTIGEAQVSKAAPVLWGTNFRQRVHPAEREAPVASLDEIRWDLLRDRFYAETRQWDEPQFRQALQWARAVGHERIAEMIASGEIEPALFDQESFAKWQPEVDVRDGAERPFTTGMRGKWFKTSGLIASHAFEGWNSMPANRWAVDSFTVLDLHSDHYSHANIRNVSAFPLDRYPGITEALQKEKWPHVWVYGVFYKNHTFETKRGREGMKGGAPLTMPMFIIMHVEPVVYDLDEGKYLGFMWIIAGSIVLLGLIFWIVFVRGESKEAARLEQHRIRLRQRMRAKGQGAILPDKRAGDAPPSDPA